MKTNKAIGILNGFVDYIEDPKVVVYEFDKGDAGNLKKIIKHIKKLEEENKFLYLKAYKIFKNDKEE